MNPSSPAHKLAVKLKLRSICVKVLRYCANCFCQSRLMQGFLSVNKVITETKQIGASFLLSENCCDVVSSCY